jgi:copper chaperone CopZ
MADSKENSMHRTTYELTGLTCQGCVKRVSEALAPFSPHANGVMITLSPMQAVITDASASVAQLQAAVARAGKYGLHATQTAEIEEKALSALIKPTKLATNSIADSKLTASSETVSCDEARPSWLQTYRPLLLILAFILGASLLVQLGQHAGHGMGTGTAWGAISAHETMRYFMAGFFLVFAFFKLLDLNAFADAYAGYDLLAARWRTWGFIYPFVELGLGMAYLANFAPRATAWVTVVVMGFSAIGVIRAVLDRRRIRCACLGSVFNLPMSTVTIVEDVGMVLMAVAMLAAW